MDYPRTVFNQGPLALRKIDGLQSISAQGCNQLSTLVLANLLEGLSLPRTSGVCQNVPV